MKKKIISTIISVAMVAGLLAGCGNSSRQSTESIDSGVQEVTTELESGKVELCVWTEEDNFDMINQMVDSFKQQYAGQADFEITLVAQADSSAKDAILADVQNAGDVFSFPDDQFSGLMAAGVLEPVANAQEVNSANYEDATAAATYNGTLYAFPYTADNGYFLYYDKRYLSESDVQTMDGLLAALEKADKKLSMDFGAGWYLYSFFGLTGLEFGINDDGITNHCNWNSTEGEIKGVDVAKALVEINKSPAFAAQSDEAFIAGAKDGTVAAGISGTWNAMAIKEAWGDDYGAVKLPTYTCAGKQIQMSSFTGYKMMGVNYYSKHKAWAMKLADWLTNEQNQTLRFEMKNQGPSNKNAAASDAVAQVPAIQAVLAQAEFGRLQRVGGKYWDPCATFANTISSGNKSNTPLQELLDILVEGITGSAAQ